MPPARAAATSKAHLLVPPRKTIVFGDLIAAKRIARALQSKNALAHFQCSERGQKPNTSESMAVDPDGHFLANHMDLELVRFTLFAFGAANAKNIDSQKE